MTDEPSAPPLVGLNDLLTRVGVAPAKTLIMRHRPTEKDLRERLPWLAAEAHETFNAYQRIQGPKAEGALRKSDHLVSFIGHEPGRAVFVGIYRVVGAAPITQEQFYAIEANRMLRELGSRGTLPDHQHLWFDLERTSHMQQWSGRLVVAWPPPERSWWRQARRNIIPVHAIHEESLLAPRVPDPLTLTLTWQDLKLLPRSWRETFRQWRGIYLIFDRASGKSYVGSAYGADNLLGRWLNYAAVGHGGNRQLRARDPDEFVFSILQRVSPDMPEDDVVALESSWKERLHTRAPYGLNDN